MLWFLIVVTLSFQQGQYPKIVNGVIEDTFYSKQECIKKQIQFFEEAKEEGIEIPPELQMGCIPFNKKGV